MCFLWTAGFYTGRLGRRRGKMDTDCPYTAAANQFDSWQQHVRNCDAIIADLNDYRGYECSNDVAFECGMAFQLGKKCTAM